MNKKEFEILRCIAEAISPSSVIFDLVIPKHLHSAVAIISTWLKLLTSPITEVTLEVPISIPTITSPIAKIIPPFYIFLLGYYNIKFFKKSQ